MKNPQVVGDFEQWSMVVIHDPDSGDIVHTHQSVTSRGGKHPDKKTLEREAMENFSLGKAKTKKKMSLLHVNPHIIKPDTHYKRGERHCIRASCRSQARWCSRVTPWRFIQAVSQTPNATRPN
jgi:hypothetical protein